MAPMPVSLIGLPYQSGRRASPTDYQMAAGPEVLLAPSAVPQALRSVTNDITMVWLDNLEDPPNRPPGSIRPTPPGEQMIRHQYQNNALSDAVKAARTQGRFPVCFSGGCNSSIGVVGGCDNPDLGMFWFDAHADDLTPDVCASGMLEAMPVSIIAGECWKAWREQIRGFHVIPHHRISQVGLHDKTAHDPNYREGVGHLVGLPAVEKWGFEGAFTRALDQMTARVKSVYIHIDTDIICNTIMRSSTHGAEGGLTPEQVVWSIEEIAKNLTIEAINFTCFDTAVDPNAPEILTKLARDLVTVIQKHRT